MTEPSPGWQIYERLVARMFADQLSTEYCVTPNARLVGRITGCSRQIDVLIDLRHESDNSRRIVVDAKKRRRRITVNDVESFRGLMEDVGATHGYLVCPNGFTKTAERRAQTAVSLRLLPLNRLEDFDPSSWPKCENSVCKAGRVFWDGYPGMTLAPSESRALADNATRYVTYIHYVGKCDRCGRFHIKCITCGEMFSTPERDEDDFGRRCLCNTPWFWLASIENDGHGIESAELHVVFFSGKVITVDRRSL